MSYTLLAETFPVARKQHRCIWCGEAILPGEKYRDERSIFDGDFQRHKWHPECDKAASEDKDMAEWGGEFEAYQNERPPTAGVAASAPTDAQREFAALSEPARRALVGASTSIQIGAHAKAYIEHNPDQWLCFQFNTWDEVMAALRAVKAWDSAGYRARDDATSGVLGSATDQGENHG